MRKILLAVLFPSALYAQNKTALFDSYMHAQEKLYGFNGNVLIAKKGNIIYERSFGNADRSSNNKLVSNSKFDCGSIAKEFTAMGILLLKDKGRLRYTDTITKFLPELPYNNITIQQLLTHTSGMANGFGLVTKFFDHNKIATNDDLVKLLAREKPPLLFTPGENLAYSGTGFNLLASIIEKVSGQPYKIYMEEQVFKPLKMAHTSVANGPRSGKNVPGLAYGYVYSDSLKKYRRADSLNTGWTTYLAGITGEGMILTTTRDLLKWDRALKNHSLLTTLTQQEMLSTHATKNTDPKASFGYGMRVEKNEFGNCYFHNGSFPGYECMHINYSDDDITAIVLSNNESHVEFIADALVAILLNKNFVMPYEHKVAENKYDADKYAGKYRIQLTRPPYMVTFPVDLIVKGDKLFRHTGNAADIGLIQETENKFFFADGTDQQIEFTMSDDHTSFTAWHIAWGLKKEMKKLNKNEK